MNKNTDDFERELCLALTAMIGRPGEEITQQDEEALDQKLAASFLKALEEQIAKD